MSDPQEALREALRKAVERVLIDVDFTERFNPPTVLWLPSALADAVLPVVQAHEKALHDRWAYALDKWRNQLKATDSMMAERDAARSDLSSLRDAVAQLADELDRLAESAKGAARMARTIGALGDEQVYLREQRALEYSARRLRSLLGDKEAQQ